MGIYENNLEFLRKAAPSLYKIILEENELQKVNLSKVENKKNYIIDSKEAKCFMHSIYNMENEIQMMLNDTPKDVETIILFGLGNGYTLKYIMENYDNLYEIVVIEPSIKIIKTYLEENEFADLFKNKSKENLYTTFIVNRDEEFVVNEIYSKMLESKKTSVIFHVSYCNAFKSYYNRVNDKLSKLLTVKRGDIATFAGEWKLWLYNSIKNLKTKDVFPIEEILETFTGKTAVIVAAGPSLNKNINLIKDIKKKAIIIAVGSAIKVLDSNGIVPHFRMAIDGFQSEKKVFDGINKNKAYLMFANQLYHKILPEYDGKKIRYILKSDYLGKYLYKKAGIHYEEFRSGASVANGALNFLCKVGCNRIVFMGQDLSYTKEGLHAKGISEENKTLDEEFIKSKKYIEVENIYGEKVYTTEEYLQMKYPLDETIKCYTNIEFFNATEGGLGIEGTKNITALELINEILKGEKNIDIEEEVNIKFENKNNFYNNKVKESLELMKKELIEINDIKNEIIVCFEKISKLRERNISISRVENEIRYIENLEKRMQSIELYNEVILTSLQAELLSIEINFGYKGKHRTKGIELKAKKLFSKIVKIDEYIKLANSILNEK